tara:strand:- start:414 stop:581 length:168 start_codon:yes stop_codon:yes gene_type:complete
VAIEKALPKKSLWQYLLMRPATEVTNYELVSLRMIATRIMLSMAILAHGTDQKLN